MTPLAGIAWATLAAALVAGGAWVVRTRWLQSHTLAKCVALSVLLHSLLAIVCAFVGGWQPASWGSGGAEETTMVVVLENEPGDESIVAADAAEPPAGAEPAGEEPRVEEPPAGAASATDTADTAAEPTEPPASAAPAPVVAVEPGPTRAAPADAPADLVPLLDASPAAALASAGQVRESAEGAAAASPLRSPPPTYADRVGARRAAAALSRGGSEATERAVQAALGWLAANQSSDGRWNAARHGGGVERAVQGQNRQNAGARSDHGVTGLALLAMLGAGNTHVDGPHAERVARGLRFLIDRQRPDGSLAGDAEFFAALYCHGMATIALAECAAMSGDAALLPPLGRAVRHTLALQHPVTGGWRYAAGDAGDTSQLGWQVMVLVSAGHAGLEGLDGAGARALGFLQRVTSGSAGGLAAYRPGERPSVAMTAEALFCRLLLGMPPDHPAAVEALGLIAGAPPSAATYNAYTWYYATLAAFHAGGPPWERWNAALQAALLPLQRRDGGPLDGSWDPDPVWGSHGGRVYSTALGALTLEVYYRHLPLHGRADRLAATP